MKILSPTIPMTSGTRTWFISPSSQVTILLPPPPAYPPHSVPDLLHLLTARGHQLDYQLYSQTDILHNLLRKVITAHTTWTMVNTDYICLQELNSVTMKPSQSGDSSQDLLTYPDDFLTATETTPESYPLLSTSLADDSFDTILTKEKFPLYSILKVRIKL
jgi:hypothetical protein